MGKCNSHGSFHARDRQPWLSSAWSRRLSTHNTPLDPSLQKAPAPSQYSRSLPRRIFETPPAPPVTPGTAPLHCPTSPGPTLLPCTPPPPIPSPFPRCYPTHPPARIPPP